LNALRKTQYGEESEERKVMPITTAFTRMFSLDAERERFRRAGATGDCDIRVVWASEAAGLIRAVEGAGALTRRIGAEAERLLQGAARHLGQHK